MAKSFLDEVIEYPVTALHKIGTDADVVKLLTDNPDIDMDSDEADEVFDKYLYDYGYVDVTTDEAAAYICIEANLTNAASTSFNDIKVYVTVICHKEFMNIDSTKFKGIIGNRRDNLTRYVDKVLNNSEVFGIGKLTLLTARVVSAPTGFTARELTYTVSEFKRKGVR